MLPVPYNSKSNAPKFAVFALLTWNSSAELVDPGNAVGNIQHSIVYVLTGDKKLFIGTVK